MTDVRQAKTQEEINRCFDTMRQLRPALSFATFADQVKRQMKEGYHLIYLEQDDQVVSTAGYRFLEFLAFGKVLLVDDLITDEKARGLGHAGKLFSWIYKQAEENGCKEIHLDSGPQRHEAHKFYLNQGFKIIAYHFARSTSDTIGQIKR